MYTHHGRCLFCQVQEALPHSAKVLHLAKTDTQQNRPLLSATEYLSIGKEWHLAKTFFAECNTRQSWPSAKITSGDGWGHPCRQALSSAGTWHSAKIFLFWFQIFYVVLIYCIQAHVWIYNFFYNILLYFLNLFCLLAFFSKK